MLSDSVLILSKTFDVRLEAAELLAAASGARTGDIAGLRQVASKLDGAAARYTDSKIAVAVAAFADLIRIAALLVEWRRAILDAEPDPDRFKRGALERLKLWRSEYSSREETAAQAKALESVSEAVTLADVGSLCLTLSRTPLPVGVYGDRRDRLAVLSSRPAERLERKPETELNVAFLHFTMDGEPADQVQFLTPYETHDLEIEVRVSRWPLGAAELRLSPVSIEATGAYEFPKFTLTPPAGEAPFVIRQRGRAMIKAAQALRAQPFEFRYAAEFWPKETEQPVSVVGHRTLRIESVDVSRSPLTGYPLMDQQLLQTRNVFRGISPMPQADLQAAMSIATPLAGLAARAVQDALFPMPISEAEFQTLIRDDLRRRPEIAARLEEHAHAGGGITDLSFNGLRLELKVVSDRHMKLADCQTFVEQAATYAVGSGKRLAILCVLDTSPKTEAPFPAEDGLGILFAKSGLPVCTILIQGNLAKPSDLSRRRARAIGGENA